jgi:hypothetical protein
MKVGAIGGSIRLNGNTNYLIDEAVDELAKRRIETEKIVFNQYRVNPCRHIVTVANVQSTGKKTMLSGHRSLALLQPDRCPYQEGCA